MPHDSVRILWHAGEPLAAGLDFFERASEIIRECNPRGVKISQTMQTNGTLITGQWCQFFVRNKVQIGVSVDGPAHVHDRHRRTLGNGPTHAGVMRGINLLNRHDIALHGVAVLTPYSLNFPDDIFDFFVETGFTSVGFNLEETEGAHDSAFGDQNTQIDRSREAYNNFMSRLFERWQRAQQRPRIREFEGMIHSIGAFLRNQDYYRTSDDLTPFSNIVVSREGEISTFSPELAGGTSSDTSCFSIGNVHEIASLEELAANQKFKDIAAEVEKGVARCRAECEYFPVCGGGTASNKFYEKGTFDCAETTTCLLHRKTLADVVARGLRKLSIPRGTSATAEILVAGEGAATSFGSNVKASEFNNLIAMEERI